MYTEYEYLAHSGIKGMKWGIRRYRNEDGTLTEAGKKRYAKMNAKVDKIYDRKTKTAYATLDRTNRAMTALTMAKDMNKTAKDHKRPDSDYDDAMNTVKSQAAQAKNTIAREKELKEWRKSQIDEGLNFYDNRIKNSAIAGAVIGGPIGAMYGAIGRAFYEEFKRGSGTQYNDIYKKYSNLGRVGHY